MIDSLETRVEAAIQDQQMVDAMLRGIKAFSNFKASLPFLPFSYTRTLLLKRPEFELVAMQWAPGSVSELHDHGDSRCWVAVLEGTIDVDSYERRDNGGGHAELTQTSSLRVNAGETDHRLSWRELHRVRNTRDISAYSLQIYSPMLTEYRIFDASTGFYTTALAHYDSVFDLT